MLCALPADGAVVVKKPGEKVQLSCGLPRGDDMEWLHEQSRVILVRKSGIPAKGYWTGSVHCFYCFHSCAGADSAHVLCQVMGIFLGESRWDKWLWRSRAWRKQMQGCSHVKLIRDQSNTCSYWSLVRPQSLHHLPPSFDLNKVVMTTSQSPPAPPPASTGTAWPPSSVRWKGPNRCLRCSGGNQMAVCTRGQRSPWNQWPIRTRAPGTAPSPTTGRRTSRGWISELKVGLWPLPKHPQRFQTPFWLTFRTAARTWESPGGQRGAGLQRLRVWSRWDQNFARAATGATVAAGTQLAVVGGDRSRLPCCCSPDGLRHLPVPENSKKESKWAVFQPKLSGFRLAAGIIQTSIY